MGRKMQLLWAAIIAGFFFVALLAGSLALTVIYRGGILRCWGGGWEAETESNNKLIVVKNGISLLGACS